MELMTIKDVSEFLRTPRGTIDTWLHTGILPREELTFRIGTKVYFDKSRLIEFLQSKQSS